MQTHTNAYEFRSLSTPAWPLHVHTVPQWFLLERHPAWKSEEVAEVMTVHFRRAAVVVQHQEVLAEFMRVDRVLAE